MGNVTRGAGSAPELECAHGDPRPDRCALCRAERRKLARLARLRASLLARPDVARHAANDHDDDDGS